LGVASPFLFRRWGANGTRIRILAAEAIIGPYTGESSFAKGHGNINLEANTVSGVMCQQDRAGTIIMSVEHHLVYHSHYATMWGYPGNGTEVNNQVPPL
jgi:hypothetical protein